MRAIRAAQAGEFYVDPALSSTIVLEEGDRTLTARQREILQMLADGMQTEAVARRLGLSTETVRTHTKRILAKLHADTRTQAVAIAIRNCADRVAARRRRVPLPFGAAGSAPTLDRGSPAAFARYIAASASSSSSSALGGVLRARDDADRRRWSDGLRSRPLDRLDRGGDPLRERSRARVAVWFGSSTQNSSSPSRTGVSTSGSPRRARWPRPPACGRRRRCRRRR